MKLNRLKIFIGPVEIGKIGGILASAYREKGLKVTVVKNRITPFQAGLKYDRTIQTDSLTTLKSKLARVHFFITMFFKHNTFIFLFGQTLLPHNLDLPFFKFFRKKTIMWFLGNDISSPEDIKKEREQFGVEYESHEVINPAIFARKKRMIRKVEKHVDHIITGPTIAHLLTRYYIGKDFESAILMPIDICNIRYNNVQNIKPIIIHAPTDQRIKGTSEILDALKRLEEEGYKFEVRLCKEMSNLEVRELLSEGDIAIDQLRSAKGGLFAIEAMAAGCAVLGGNIPQISRISDLPIIHTDTTNVYNNIKLLLNNPDLRKELGLKGREYAERYHDHRKIADHIIKLLEVDIS